MKLDASSITLASAVADAHHRAAHENSNASSAVVIACAQLGVPFEQALASAMGTLGGHHAPVSSARRVLFEEETALIEKMAREGWMIPGWGNGFHSGLDPIWQDVSETVAKHYPETTKRLETVTDAIERARGKRVQPNAAAFTAILAEVTNIASGAESALFVSFRMRAWQALYESNRSQRKVWLR